MHIYDYSFLKDRVVGKKCLTSFISCGIVSKPL